MNKKYAVMLGIGIALVISVVGLYVLSAQESKPVNKNLRQQNETTPAAKNYSIQLHESVGIKSK
ncbi:MAG: hypothetical protein ABI342_09625 [Nitrososphaera sp.]